MKGLCIEGAASPEAGGVRFRDDLERPKPLDGETRVRLIAAGVCATDLALSRGYMDFRGVPGHEFCGVALDGPLEGRKVVGEINAGCGTCARCRGGDSRHCATRTVLGILGRPGAFAEEFRLPTRNLHAVPDTVSTDAATFTEPLAAALRIPEVLDVRAFERVLVVGDGRLGLLCARVLQAERSAPGTSLAPVEVAGRHPERAALLGPMTPLGPAGGPGGPLSASYDLVVEASGRPEVLRAALECVRPEGTLVLKTTTERPVPLDLARAVVNEIRILGSRCGPFAPALEALATGRVQVEDLIQARFPLTEGVRALATAAGSSDRPRALKVLIENDVHDA